MCKQPAVYYCASCGTYCASPPAAAHDHPIGPVCPNCSNPVTSVDPDDANHKFYCPQCQLPVLPLDAIPPDGAKPLSCSVCGTELVKPSDTAPNPVSFPVALQVLGMVARLLLVSGAAAALEEYARKSATPIDDLSAHVAIALIKECAKL